MVKKSKKKVGTSIAERPIDINNCTEFWYWKIDAVIGENDSEFIDLSTLEYEIDTKVYFTHSYSSNDISFIEDWMNTLPRRIPKYKTLEEVVEIHLY